jgi:DNA-binding MarR family transcriptional regulator
MGQLLESDEQRLTTVGLLMESASGLRRVFQRRIAAGSPLSSQSFDVLIRLARTPGGELRMSELAAQTALTPSGLTRSIDRLQTQGLVDRRICPEDRRGAFAVLTDQGRGLMDRAIPEHIEHVNDVLGTLYTPDEEQMLSTLLRRLRDHLYDTDTGWGLSPGDDGEDCPSSR